MKLTDNVGHLRAEIACVHGQSGRLAQPTYFVMAKICSETGMKEIIQIGFSALL
jgi:hypothetical protein